MHELSIALSIVAMAEEEARGRGVQVNAVHLKLGTLSGVVKEALLFSYDLACEGTLLEGSHLLIEEVQTVVYCPACRAERALDSVQSAYMIVKQVVEGRAEVENQYSRVVLRDGNVKALEVIFDVFEPRDYFEWRGLGSIPRSGMKLQKKYAAFDAELKFAVPGLKIADPKACQCGEILKGVKKPWECKVFGTACTPETPIGSCMVSSEGACAAYYNFGRLSKVAERASLNAQP